MGKVETHNVHTSINKLSQTIGLGVSADSANDLGTDSIGGLFECIFAREGDVEIVLETSHDGPGEEAETWKNGDKNIGVEWLGTGGAGGGGGGGRRRCLEGGGIVFFFYYGGGYSNGKCNRIGFQKPATGGEIIFTEIGIKLRVKMYSKAIPSI